mgnify:CR=1 FL=1
MARRSLLTLCLTTLSIDALLAPQLRLRHRVRRRASDDEAPEVEEDWRAFRARLVAGGIPTTTDADEPAPAAPPAEERQGLDEDNVKLATSQSKRQGDMLREGTWAHEVGAPEVGGLLLRLPLETQYPSFIICYKPRMGERQVAFEEVASKHVSVHPRFNLDFNEPRSEVAARS